MTPSPSHRDFRWYLLSQTTAALGEVFTGAATSIVAVQVLHATAAEVGVLAASATLPAVLIGPVAGVLADRARRPRRLLIIGDLVNAVAVAGAAAGLLLGVATLGWLIALNVLLGSTMGVMHTVYFAHLNALGIDGLAKSRARLQRNEYLAASVAGAAAAPSIAAFGGPTAYLLDAVARLVSAGALSAIGTPDRNPAHADEPANRMGFGASMAEGLRAMRDTVVLRRLAILAFFVQLGFSGGTALYALFVLRTLGVPTAWYGVPSLCAMLLGVVGSVLAPRLLDRGWTTRRMLAVGYVGIAVSGLAIPLAAGPVWLCVIVLACGLAARSLFGAISNIGLVGVMTDEVGDHLFGRVSATLGTLITSGSAIAALLAGWLGTTIGVRTAVLLCSLLVLVSVLTLIPLVRRSPTAVEREPVVAR